MITAMTIRGIGFGEAIHRRAEYVYNAATCLEQNIEEGDELINKVGSCYTSLKKGVKDRLSLNNWMRWWPNLMLVSPPLSAYSKASKARAEKGSRSSR